MATKRLEGTKILACVCKNAYQDKVYGKGMRVHNGANPKGASYWRCTCCLARKEEV
jgi:hypothetical protein